MDKLAFLKFFVPPVPHPFPVLLQRWILKMLESLSSALAISSVLHVSRSLVSTEFYVRILAQTVKLWSSSVLINSLQDGFWGRV